LIDWPENCSSYTRAWRARQQWLPPATINVADDGVVLSMVAEPEPDTAGTTTRSGLIMVARRNHPPAPG
jgi:hypothetical protein